MKHFRSVVIILSSVLLVFIMSSCKNRTLSQNNYIDGQDYQYMYFVQGSSPSMAETKDGYYFFSGYYLYYADKKSMKPVILCNKPNCLHADETNPEKVDNCDAFFKGAGPSAFLAYYDGYLYATSTVYGKEKESYQLVRISLDGTKRKSVLTFDVPPMSIAIHRGKVYYVQSAFDKNQRSAYKICEFNLNKFNSKSKNIYLGNLEGGSIQDLKCYGNNLYFEEFANTEKAAISRQMRYDLLSHKTSRLFTDNDQEYASAPAIYNNKLYYNIGIFNKDGTPKVFKYYTSDLNGENRKESFKIDYISNVLSDKNHLYIDDVVWSTAARPKDQQSLNIIDADGKLVDTIKTDFIKNDHTVVLGSDQHLFIKTQIDDKFYTYYADKKQFGSGKVELKPFFENDSKRMFKAIIKNH